MRKIDFLNKEEVINGLLDEFPTQPIPSLSENMKGLGDPELVYFFFNKKME